MVLKQAHYLKVGASACALTANSKRLKMVLWEKLCHIDTGVTLDMYEL